MKTKIFLPLFALFLTLSTLLIYRTRAPQFNPIVSESQTRPISYFDDAIFLGDSLIKGFDDSDTYLSEAMVCGYKGMSPDQVVMKTKMEHHERGYEVILDILAEKQPKKLYILTGTNNMSAINNEDFFIKYYGMMLDEIKAVLPDNSIIYIQSLPPVLEGISKAKPGLSLDRLESVNNRLVALAKEKGVYYIDLWPVLANENKFLKTEFALEDGIHMNAEGYEIWRDWLLTHTI